MIITPTDTIAPQDREAAELRKAAIKFEGIMLNELLKSALPATGGASETAMGPARQSLADMLAQSQPFGIANLMAPNKKANPQ